MKNHFPVFRVATDDVVPTATRAAVRAEVPAGALRCVIQFIRGLGTSRPEIAVATSNLW
ncbi:MAG TPA: hypothetical protein VIW93_04260 [Candidatus Acidoferrum sp.]|jgi:hypothetical protein